MPLRTFQPQKHSSQANSSGSASDDGTKPALLTVFADLSFDAKFSAAGWACWLKGPNAGPKGETNGGAFDFNIKDTREGELWALAYALAWAFEKFKLPEIEAVILQSDNINSLGLISGRLNYARPVRASHGTHPIHAQHNPNPSEIKALVLIHETLKSKTTWLKHVKGHQGGVHARSSVNETCDRIAKEYMRERRDEIIRGMKAG